MAKTKESIKFGLKLAVGAVLIYYVFFHTTMVDFSMLKSVWSSPINLALSLVFLLFSAVMCATRWFLLVRAQQLNLSFKDLFELTMIGNFFNTFMPGSVGGDLIKAWYVAGQEPDQKTKAIFTVLLDRIIGLTVIILYAGVTLLFFMHWLQNHLELKALALSLWGFTGVAFASAVLFFSPSLWALGIVNRSITFLRRWKRVETIIDATLLYQNHFGRVVLATTLSMLSIFATSILYCLQGQYLGIPTPMSQYFFIVPVGLTVSAVPLLPGGIGVGQVAFYKLFEWTGAADPRQGATLCTLMQLYTILFNCIGAVFYLKFKKKPRGLTQAAMMGPLVANP